MGAHVAYPDKTPAGAIIAIMEIWGVNDTMRRHAQEFAEAGFVCLVPDLFWRQEPGVELSDHNPEHVKKAFDLYYEFDYDLGVQDMDRYAEFPAKLSAGATARSGGRLLSGRQALLPHVLPHRHRLRGRVLRHLHRAQHQGSEEPASPVHAAHGDEGPLGAGEVNDLIERRLSPNRW
jgi:carboxymethylenebutenolidase